MIEKRFNLNQALLMALLFGFFQAAMPVVGWGISKTFYSQIEAFEPLDCICPAAAHRSENDMGKQARRLRACVQPQQTGHTRLPCIRYERGRPCRRNNFYMHGACNR